MRRFRPALPSAALPSAALLPVLLLLLLLWPAVAAAQEDPAEGAAAQNGGEPVPIQATDLYKIRELSEVAVAPDGRSIVYTVKRVTQQPDTAGGPAYRTHLYRVDAGGRSEPQQLTFGEESAYGPVWHPGGERLAFVREVDGEPQVFILPLTGGESYQLTHAEHGASDPAFSPSGDRLLFASRLPEKALREATEGGPDWPSERPGRTAEEDGSAAGSEDTAPNPDGSLAAVRAYLAEERETRPSVTSRLDFQGERGLEPTLVYRHLFVVGVPPAPPEDGNAPEATRITSGFASFGGGSWMADGEGIVTSGAPVTSGAHPDRVRDSDLYVAATGGPGQERLLSMDGYALSSPAVSPAGEHVAFSASRLADAGYAQGEIGLYRLRSGEGAGGNEEAGGGGGVAGARLLTGGFDRSAGPPQWSPDGWRLYTTAPSAGDFPLYRLSPFASTAGGPPPAAGGPPPADSAAAPADSARVAARPDSGAAGPAGAGLAAGAATPIERLTGQRRGVHAFDVGRASLFYVATRPENPFELYASTANAEGISPGDIRAGDSLGTGTARRLTGHNAAWLSGRVLSVPEPFSVQSDTFEVDGWTMRPTSDSKGRPAPLLVQIHGGPSAMWGPGEATMWHEFQFFAAQGYALVYSNPRGSGGYGQSFKKANYRDWGRGPARDVLTAADYAASLDWTDAGRQVVTGGSYAGYLTAWIVAHTTGRFRAAAAQRGVYDLATFLGEGNAWRLVPWHFGGFPWEGGPARDAATVLASSGMRKAPALDRAPELQTSADSAAGGAAAATRDTAAAAVAEDAERSPSASGLNSNVASGVADLVPRNAMGSRGYASAREALTLNSPITFVDQIRTPLLIMHADEDLRTGVSQSEMLYRSLKVLGRPVEYVRYPEAGHDLSRTGDPAQRLDRILRIWEFFERYL